MLKNFRIYLAFALLCTVLFSCAKEESESNASIQKRILDAYLEVNYPEGNYTVTESGLVILNHEPGVGIPPQDLQAAYARHSTKGLDGNYQTTTFKDVAERLGVYDPANYYGNQLLTLGYGDIVKGLNEALRMMNKGAKMTVIVPPHLSCYDSDGDYYGYTSSSSETSTTNLIYEIELGDVITDVFQFQLDSLEAFRNINYPGLDTVVSGYYFKKLSGFRKDTVPDGTKVNVWYVGKLLDGYVFDTNIEDTAKKYGLYDATKTYSALEVTMQSTFEEMTSKKEDGSNSSASSGSEGGEYVEGFARALKSMTYGDEAITFFNSDRGYGSKSTMSGGSGVPSYSMLYFYIYMDPEEF